MDIFVSRETRASSSLVALTAVTGNILEQRFTTTTHKFGNLDEFPNSGILASTGDIRNKRYLDKI